MCPYNLPLWVPRRCLSPRDDHRTALPLPCPPALQDALRAVFQHLPSSIQRDALGTPVAVPLSPTAARDGIPAQVYGTLCSVTPSKIPSSSRQRCDLFHRCFPVPRLSQAQPSHSWLWAVKDAPLCSSSERPLQCHRGHSSTDNRLTSCLFTSLDVTGLSTNLHKC